jgi:ABC-type nitrate/sulfonate/bicarbonate transport system substrate-binding protein
MKMRVCTKCGQEKPETVEYFCRNKKCRGGITRVCKVCHNKETRRWQAENPEKVMESVRRWQSENPEKVRESARGWYARNSEKARESVRRRQAENPEKHRERARRWNAENPEKHRERVRRWKAENPAKVRKHNRRWKAENPAKVREIERDRDRRYVDALAPTYLKRLIANKYDIHYSEIGDELINAKRREMKYYRQRNQLKK